MGFFDFIKSAASTVICGVSGVVEHSPILKTLAPLAGIVAHAIPAVGPVIDAAIPALHAVFSNDSNAAVLDSVAKPVDPPPQPQPQSTDLQAIIDRQTADIQKHDKERDDLVLERLSHNFDTRISENFHNLEQNLENKVKGYLEDFKTAAQDTKSAVEAKIAEIGKQTKEDLIAVTKHEIFNKSHATLDGAITYMQTESGTLAKLTAYSGEDQFSALFGKVGAGNDTLYSWREEIQKEINAIGEQLNDTTWVPSKEMCDIYLALVHWVLIFHKAIIVTKGMQSRTLFVTRQYEKYFEAQEDVHQEITKVRSAACKARNQLLKVANRLSKERQNHIIVKDTEVDGKTIRYFMEDTWPTLAVGWISKDTMNLIAYDEGNGISKDVEKTMDDAAKQLAKNQVLKSPMMVLYRETVLRCLEENLRPCREVIDSLEENLQYWANRTPVALETTNEAGEVIKLVTAAASKAHDRKAPALKFKGNSLWYRISYVTTKGESQPSDWSDKVDIDGDYNQVKLTFTQFKFQGDPFRGLTPIEDKKKGIKAHYDRGFRRRVYVRYITDTSKADGSMSYALVKEVNESELTTLHDLTEYATKL